MKTIHGSSTARRAAWVLGVALVFAHQAAQACEGCKQAITPGTNGNTPSVEGASLGFGLSIFFMIAMIMGIISGLGFMMYRSCRVLAAQQSAALAQMEAEEATGMLGLPARA